MTTTADVLNKAADHIEKVGLHKGQFFEGYQFEGYQPGGGRLLIFRAKDEYATVPCCTVGAIYVAAETTAQVDAAIRVINGLIPSIHYGTAADWNDVPWRLKGEVVAMLRRAAEKAETDCLWETPHD